MNPNLISAIADLVFIERQNRFPMADVVLYHPGHFPELNKFIFDLYENEGFKQIMIPSIHNPFLNANEYETHKNILVEYGIPRDIILPIEGEQHAVRDVIRNAMASLAPEQRNILLAGKSFFCRRFLLLASIYARPDMVLDVYPLEDGRGINKHTWYESAQGMERVRHELSEYASILEP